MKKYLKRILSVILFIILIFFMLGDGGVNNSPIIIGDDVNDLVEAAFSYLT